MEEIQKWLLSEVPEELPGKEPLEVASNIKHP